MSGELDRGGFIGDLEAVRAKLMDGIVKSVWVKLTFGGNGTEWGRVLVQYDEQGAVQTLWQSDRIYVAEYAPWMFNNDISKGIACIDELMGMKSVSGLPVLPQGALQALDSAKGALSVVIGSRQPDRNAAYLAALALENDMAVSIVDTILRGQN